MQEKKRGLAAIFAPSGVGSGGFLFCWGRNVKILCRDCHVLGEWIGAEIVIAAHVRGGQKRLIVANSCAIHCERCGAVWRVPEQGVNVKQEQLV